MGELIKNDVVSNWLATVDGARTGLIEAAKGGNKIATAFAMAEARATLIESLADPQIRARLLRITDDKIGMVELANNPSEDDRVRICAMAILSGFCPGDDQFAVFGAGKDRSGNSKPGKLYIKEAGFRTLFAHLGIVPTVETGHPEYVELGKSGKKVWRVGGRASCEYRGQKYVADFSGPAALGVPGYDSDNVAGISAKARRKMLQALWQTVSPILNDDPATDDDGVTTISPANLENSPTATTSAPPEMTERLRMAKAFDQSFNVAQRRIKDAGQLALFNQYWEAITNTKNKSQLSKLDTDLAAAGTIKTLGMNNVKELQEYSKWVAEGMAE